MVIWLSKYIIYIYHIYTHIWWNDGSDVLTLTQQDSLATYPSKIDLISGKCSDIVVEQVDKKQCCKCRGHQVLEMFLGDNATCNGCLAHRKRWAGNNPAKVRGHGDLVNIRKKRRHTIKNIMGGKHAKLRHAIG